MKESHKISDPSRKEVWKENATTLSLFGKRIPAFYPNLTDPRIVQILILTTVTLLGQLVFHFRITPLQILTLVITAVLLDIMFTFITRNIIIFPASGFISSLSLALLLQVDREPYQYLVYIGASVLAIASKYLITFDKRHVFNPSNFAIVFLLYFLPQDVSINPDEWRTSFILILPIILLGTRLIIKARVYGIALSFFAAELFFFGLYTLNGDLKTYQEITHMTFSLFSPSLLIFTFFMITDPRTVPKNQLGKVLFGGFIGALHWVYLSYGLSSLSLFLALFTMSMTVPVVNRFTDKLTPSQV